MSKLTGDWDRAVLKFKNLPSDITETMQEQKQASADYLKEQLQNYIYGQKGDWDKLSPATVELKDGDTTILIETGELVESIEVTPVDNGYVIAPTGSRNQEIMMYHEYGTSKMPPRPVIQPVYEMEKDNVIKDFGNALKKALD